MIPSNQAEMTKKIPKKSIVISAGARRQIGRGLDFKFVRELLKEFPKSDVYLVGGAVRDAVMGRATKDYDFVVTKVPAVKLAAFLKKHGEVNLVGKNFGVYKFVPIENPSAGSRRRSPRESGATLLSQGLQSGDPKNPLDIALPRRDFAFGTGGYRDFDVQSDASLPIEADLARRDFTWNAMAWSARKKILIDPWNGLVDLKSKIVRTVGGPAERFKEDYTRILRAIRFALVFGFKIEKETLAAVKRLVSHLNDERVIDAKHERVTPYEMVSEEFLKALAADPVKTMGVYRELGALKVLMPELLEMSGCGQPREYHAEGDVWAHTMLALKNLAAAAFVKKFGPPSAELILAVLFHDIGKPPARKKIIKDGEERVVFYEHDEYGARLWRQVAERMKFSAVPDFSVSTERVEWLIRSHLLTWNNNPYQMRETTLEKYFFNPKYFGDDLLALSFADARATFPDGRNPDLKNLNRFVKKINSMKKMAKGKKVLPPPILDGNSIMKILGLKPGPKVGEIILLLREEQLTGRVKDKKEAEGFLKKLVQFF